jgi:hypothetical protein
MLIVVTLKDGTQIPFNFKLHCAIDQMVAALKENVADWIKIEISITRK